MSAILVVAEHRDGELREATLEAVGAALQLAQAVGASVATAVLAADPEPLAAPLLGRSPTVRLLAHPELANYDPDGYIAALSDVIESLKPLAILMGHTSQGMDLAPALAGRLGLPMVSDCVALELSDGNLQVQRQSYGGKITETLSLRSAPMTVLTLQGGAFAVPDAGADTESSTVALTELSRRHRRRFLEHVVAAVEDVDIAAADILVSVGRGIGKEENIALAQELADAIGATVSCSRPVADSGWLPQSRQVGTSGKTVRPKLYIALGISGAFQHLAGMKGSDTIIAVNKDPKAPIFQVATYGIVEDVLEVLPQLTQQLRG